MLRFFASLKCPQSHLVLEPCSQSSHFSMLGVLHGSAFSYTLPKKEFLYELFSVR